MYESGVPKYQQIKNDIVEKIYQNIYKPASKLPSENQMAKLYKTSVPTVRKALGELVHQDMIYRVKGSGTYVCDRHGADLAAGAASGPSLDICFLVFSDFNDSSVMKMIRGAQSCLFADGANLSILYKQENMVTEADLIETCHNNGVDGIIYFAEEPYVSQESFRLIKKYGIPAVMIDRGPDNYPYTLVAAYNLDGGYQMAKYLLELGHRKIAFVSERMSLAAEKDRFRGYSLALKERGIYAEEELLIQWEKSGEQQDKLIELVKSKKITAIQSVNDKIAAEIIQRVQKEGLRVPQDVSVGGFDEWDEVKYMIPRVTTIFQPFEEMGRVAAEKLLEMLNGKKMHSQTYLPVTLVVKDSCSPPSDSPKELA